MFLSRSIERQAGQDRKTVVIDGFSKKAELTNIFCAYIHIFFFSCNHFREIWISRVFNFAKSTKIGETREIMYTRKLVRLS